MTIFLLFLSTVVQVILIAMQTIQIVANRPIWAAACATGIAFSNLIAFKMVPGAGIDAMLAYVTANAIGVPIAMLIEKKLRARKSDSI